MLGSDAGPCRYARTAMEMGLVTRRNHPNRRSAPGSGTWTIDQPFGPGLIGLAALPD